MGGWVKWEKDKEQEPGFKRLVRKVRNTCVTGALPPETLQSLSVTLTMGALLKFWSFADTYIRADDTLDMGPDDIDDLVGIPGFAAAMPTEWLRVIDAEHVELPAYQSHNGIEAKKAALAQKRMENKRTRDQRNDSVTPRAQARNGRVTGASPDQTRPDQTRPRPPSQSERVSETKLEVPACGNGEECLGHAAGNGRQVVTPSEAPQPTDDPNDQAAFEHVKSAYPPGIYPQSDWLEAEREARRRIDEGYTWVELIDGCRRYAAQLEAREKIGTEFVGSPKRFFTQRERKFREEFPLPRTKAEARQDANIDAGQEWLEESARAAQR